MRAFLAIMVSLVAVTLPLGQQTDKPIGILGPEDVIRRMIASGIYEGHDAKTLGGMGDAAAVLVTKVVAGKHLSTNEIDTVLTILNVSFAGRATEAADREPRTALFILQFCDSSAQDPGLKTRIAQTKTYIQGEFAKSKQSSAQR
jgi:hypothetical protein